MPICAKDDLKGVRIIKTENGLPINVRKSVMENAGKNTRGSCDGVTRSPSKKKIIICAISVKTSKK